MQVRDVLKKPIITEKSILATALDNYTFKVDLSANKPQIKQAIEKLFKVKVVKVRTIKVKGKTKRAGARRNNIIKTSSWKKAIVTLKEGDKIDIFELTEK